MSELFPFFKAIQQDTYAKYFKYCTLATYLKQC